MNPEIGHPRYDEPDRCESIEAVLAFDIKDFSGMYQRDRSQSVSAFRDCIRNALYACELHHVWDESEEQGNIADRGDGVIISFNGNLLRPVVQRFPDALQRELYHRFHHHADHLRMRMRLGITVGPRRPKSDERADSASDDILIEAARLSESDQVRALLDHSDHDATFLAVGLSEHAMHSAVRHYNDLVHQSRFVKVEAVSKTYSEPAYLYVPTPSGALLVHGYTGPEIKAEPESDDTRVTVLRSLLDARGDAAPGGESYRNSPRTGDVSNGSNVAGRDVRQDRVTQHFGDKVQRDKHQYEADSMTVHNRSTER